MNRSFFSANRSFAHFWTKNERFALKSNEQIPSPDCMVSVQCNTLTWSSPFVFEDLSQTRQHAKTIYNADKFIVFKNVGIKKVGTAKRKNPTRRCTYCMYTVQHRVSGRPLQSIAAKLETLCEKMCPRGLKTDNFITLPL